jgi:PPK2 family polyphosphate:nucleotide phosphotransferase
MKIVSKNFRVSKAKKINLKKWPTNIKPVYNSREEYKQILEKHISQLCSLQDILYASNQYALLLIFQAMDAAGKDGVIKHVMSGINPQGCQVFSFKHPSATELTHDFLWRTYNCFPERGKIGIFNRSYYEEVLIVRVHPEILKGEGIIDSISDGKEIWKERYHSIVEVEKHLNRNRTKVIKFFLHLSEEEQRNRFLSRIDEPKKNWKFNQTDIEERKFWKQYMKAYEDCIGATSTKESPWYIVPADDKGNARLIVSQIILDTMKKLKLSFPRSDENHEKELQSIRAQLTKTE